MEIIAPPAGLPPADPRIVELDPGELETIRVICWRRGSGESPLFLTSDRQARRGARDAGIRSLDLFEFLIFCNRRRLLPGDRILGAAGIPGANRYRLSKGFKNRLPGRPVIRDRFLPLPANARA